MFATESVSDSLGEVTKGERIHKTYTIRNQGDGVLQIEAIDPGCFGTSSASSMTVAPRSQSELQVTYDTHYASNSAPEVFKTILRTNDPAHLEVTLMLGATVRAEFVLSEQLIDFGRTRTTKAPIKRVIQVVVDRESQATLTNVRSTDQAVQVEWNRMRTDSHKYLLELSVVSRSPGTHLGNVIVTTSSALTPELRIPVKGFIEGGTL